MGKTTHDCPIVAFIEGGEAKGELWGRNADNSNRVSLSTSVVHRQERHFIPLVESDLWVLMRVENTTVEHDDDVRLNSLDPLIEDGFWESTIICRKTAHYSPYGLTFGSCDGDFHEVG